ncbi:MAG: hypothetical protein KKA07_08775 [Bacteroidetes bacterium]|nr:hypothetical protein [Bacteroidota bacterium]MBU1719155.1 hypothetical protein [Bacteroidota bacterium]
MNTGIYNISLNFNQILQLVRQLPVTEKIMLSRELEKEALSSKLTQLLEAFKTNELDDQTIKSEVDRVRDVIYGKKKKN